MEAGTAAAAAAAASASTPANGEGTNDWAATWTELLRQEAQVQPDGRFSWDQVSRLLATLRAKFSNYAWRSVTKPRARAYIHPATGRSRVRLYYLIANDFLGQTLWCVDLGTDSADTAISNRRLVNLATIKSHLAAAGAGAGRSSGVSRDEELLQERKRSYSTGITDYDLEPASGTVAFAYQNFVCHFVDRLPLPQQAQQVDTPAGGGGASAAPPPVASEEPEDACCRPHGVQAPHSPLNLALCPGEPRVAAYAAERSVYCVSLDTGAILQAYNSSSCLTSPSSSAHISAGLPPFAVQEEFDRFLGFWWRPAPAVNTAEDNAVEVRECDLVIEVVDESAVASISIVDPLKAGVETDSFAYPRAGTPNAVSSLVLVRVSVAASRLLSVSPHRPLSGELGSGEATSDREYLVRVEWSPAGEILLAQTMSRAQDRLSLWAYLPESDSTVRLMEEVAPEGHWIEVHDQLRVLSVSPGSVAFLWASEDSGFRHLYHVTASWRPGDRLAAVQRRQLTSGDWQVQPDHLAVDAANQVAYFNSTIVDPRAVQLCRVSYAVGSQQQQQQQQQSPTTPAVVDVLTQAFYTAQSSGSHGLPKTCNGLAFPTERIALLTVHCSSHSPVAQLCRLDSGGGSQLAPLLALTSPIECDKFFLEPEYFEFTGPGGQTLYGLLFKPFDYRVGQQYPTVQYVYGGPHVQLVNNTFVGYSFHRVTKACYFGFCVLIVDNRGSDNRGREFAAQVRRRLGSLELPDQIAGLRCAAERFGCIDLNRVGLFGWSYGGYLSLLGMRDHSRVYRLGVSGAPVTEWELYDTAYTERYMGLPDGPCGVYYSASAISGGLGISGYPSEANRLLIVHGSIDENVHFYHTARLLDRLAGARKPYSLLLYPSERHGLRNAASKEHFEISLMHFLCQNL